MLKDDEDGRESTPVFKKELDNPRQTARFDNENSNFELAPSSQSARRSQRSVQSTNSRESSLSLLSLDSIQDRSDLAPHQINMLMQRAIQTGNLNWENLSYADKAYFKIPLKCMFCLWGCPSA